GECCRVDGGPGNELARDPGPVASSGLDLDIDEAGSGELVAVFHLVERAGDTADPELDAPPELHRHRPPNDDVRHGEPATRLEDSEGLRQDTALAGGRGGN